MSLDNLLRSATLALALTALTGAMGTAFAADTAVTMAQKASASSPYDGNDFIIQNNNINS